MIADLQTYPTMKDSGVEWLGEVPAHWKVLRLKQICRLAYGDSLADTVRRDGAVPVLGSNGRVGFHDSANTKAPCIIIGRKGSFGKVNYSPDPAFAIDTTFFVDSRFSSANIRWLFYLLRWLRLDEVTRDSAIPGLDREDTYQRPGALPPLSEQAAIVRFLDYIDRRIQRYVRAKEKLIALLEEQKKAIIHEAVTGQIDVRTGRPYPAYMDSGVEWLGEVPSHWEVKRIGRFSKVGNGSTPSRGNPAYWSNGDHPWLNSSSVNKGTIATADQFVTDRALRECHLPRVPANSVLVGITGQGKTRGMAALLTIDATINQHMAYITPSTDTISPRYLHICLAAAYAELRGLSSASGSTKEALTCEDIKTFRLVLPPIDEQEVLLSAVARRLRSLARCTSDARRQIDLAQEYRTRLIADVVTGKLDVRGVAARLPEPDAPADGDTPDGIRAASGLDTRAEELAAGGVDVRHGEVEVRGAADAATVAWRGAEEAVAGDRR